MDLPRQKIGTTKRFLPVYLQGRDRYLGTTLIGASGTGKSSYILSSWAQDELFRVARVLIEPSGFLAKEAYGISGEKALYCSLETPISLNPLAQPYHENQIVDTIAESINQVIQLSTSNMSLTARMHNYLAGAVIACLRRNRRTLVNVRDYLAQQKQDVTSEGLLARLDYLLSDTRLNQILCGPSPIEWGEFIKSRRAFIVDCFGMSYERMVFLGNLISQGIKNYFRYERPKQYLPLSVYIDEAHNFVNPNLLDVLKEGRKFKLACLLSTQDFALLGEKLARVMLNVGNLISFRVGFKEAQLISREMRLRPEDLQFLSKFHVAYKTPEGVGVLRAPRPPIVKTREPKKKTPKLQHKWHGWFPISPDQSRI